MLPIIRLLVDGRWRTALIDAGCLNNVIYLPCCEKFTNRPGLTARASVVAVGGISAVGPAVGPPPDAVRLARPLRPALCMCAAARLPLGPPLRLVRPLAWDELSSFLENCMARKKDCGLGLRPQLPPS